MAALAPRPGLLDIAAYVPGHAKAVGCGRAIKLSSNETPLGPSPKALEAAHASLASLERYPDGSATRLRQAIARVHGLNADRIVCGAGSDELLSLLANAYLSPGDEAIHSRHGFLVYPIITRAAGATPVVADETNHTCDVDAILGCVSPRTRIVFLANPNNPTGTYVPIAEVRRLRSELPENVLLVLDAAYAEYVRRNDYEAGIELVSESSNTVMTRTFSKVHGLAALRLGWAYCPESVADVVNRIRGPFNVSETAIAAGVAAIEDVSHMAAAVAHNDIWLENVTDGLASLGIRATPSVGNFLLAHFDESETGSAASADAHLQASGIFVRRMEGYGLPNALRISIGTQDDNEALLTVLREWRSASVDAQSEAVGRAAHA